MDKEGQKIHGTYKELVHNDYRRIVPCAQDFGHGGIADFREDRYDQQQESHPEGFADRIGDHRDKHDATETYQNAEYVDNGDFLPECQYANQYGKYRAQGNDEGTVGRRLRELDAVGLGHKIYQRLEHGHEQKLRHIPAMNSQALPPGDVPE